MSWGIPIGAPCGDSVRDRWRKRIAFREFMNHYEGGEDVQMRKVQSLPEMQEEVEDRTKTEGVSQLQERQQE